MRHNRTDLIPLFIHTPLSDHPSETTSLATAYALLCATKTRKIQDLLHNILVEKKKAKQRLRRLRVVRRPLTALHRTDGPRPT